MITLLLASASPARAATLRAAGVEPVIEIADVDEEALLAAVRAERASTQASTPRSDATDPEHPLPNPLLPVAEAVLILARAKAERIALGASTQVAAADVIVGCDSLLELDGEPLGKPGSAAVAIARWQRMRGRTATLHTGHWLIAGDGGTAGDVSSTAVTFADVSDAEIHAYVATGEPLQVAGAFTIDGLGGAFVTRIEGDHHGVVGLSLPLLRTLLRQLGLDWTDLWTSPDTGA